MNRGFYKALSVSVAVALLPSCGGSQQIGQTASPQLRRDATSTPLPGGAVSHRASRPLARYPKRRHGLLYVGATYYTNAIDIFPLTGPNQQQVGSITNGIDAPWGLSVDSNKSLYVANAGNGTVTVYPYGSSTPSMTYSIFGAALYALADSAGHVFLSGWNKHHQGHVIEFNAGRNRVIAHQQLGSETDGMAEDGQGNLYVAYRADGTFANSSIAEFSGPDLTNMRVLGMTVDQPQGLLVDRAGNIIVAESAADRIDVFPPGATAPSVTVTISGIGNLAELAMQNSETTLWVSSEGGYVYSMPYPLSWSTVAAEYEERLAESNGIAVTP
jgi:DNA-binding beta-propeller fold protein YncE